MYSIGIDSGSTTTKGVLFDGENIIEKIIVATGANPRRTMEEIYKRLYRENAFTVTTGYGRELLKCSDKKVTEITCHGKGATFFDKQISAVIDIGGQDSKVILLDQHQKVKDFLMNDKCAAGTGRFIEVIMRLLQEDLCDLDHYVEDAEGTKISSMCTVFAESEVVSLLAQDVSGPSIAKGVIDSISQRTASFAKRIPIEGRVFFSGGLAQSASIMNQLERNLGLKVVTHKDAQFVGAVGAALIGNQYMKK
jgi:predicted CoA-substrate-specific enzyme activase